MVTRRPAKKAAAKTTPPPEKTTAKKAAARKATPAKKAAGKRSTAKKTAPSTSKGAETASTPPPPAPKYGLAETATRNELEGMRIAHSALAVSAILLARQLDQADSAAGASAAARELRMTLGRAESVVKPLSPPEEGETGKVEPPNRLVQLREKRERAAARRAR